MLTYMCSIKTPGGIDVTMTMTIADDNPNKPAQTDPRPTPTPTLAGFPVSLGTPYEYEDPEISNEDYICEEGAWLEGRDDLTRPD